MVIGNVRDVEWCNGNELRRFPLADSAAGTAISSDFILPTNFIVDAKLCTYAYNNPTQFYISTVGVYSYGITISLAYENTTLATLLIPAETHQRYDVYPFSSPVANGHLVIGDLTTIMENLGAYRFNAASTRFTGSVVTPYAGGLQAMYVMSNGVKVGPLTGIVTFQARNNMHIVYQNGVAYLDAVGFKDYTQCECPDYEINNPDMESLAVRKINNSGPDTSGNFSLLGYHCLQINPLGDAQLLFDDTCSQSCCGCDELKVIQGALDLVTANMVQLNHVAERLQDAIGRIVTSTVFSNQK